MKPRRSLLSTKSAVPVPRRKESLNLISTGMLRHLTTNLRGLKESTENGSAGMLTDDSLPSVSRKGDVALVVGGGNDPLSEYEAAKVLCDEAKLSIANFVCNDMIALFPMHIDHAVTLHPDKMYGWLDMRKRYGHPMPVGRMWCHRPYRGFSDNTRDWQGSSGLFMTKIARELGYTKIILAGVPMQVEADHFVRHQRWNAAPGFVRGWRRRVGILKPFVRSMSGWTQEELGAPTLEWLTTPNPTAPLPGQPVALTA